MVYGWTSLENVAEGCSPLDFFCASLGRFMSGKKTKKKPISQRMCLSQR